jgi:flagellin-specific chaperone FliS
MIYMICPECGEILRHKQIIYEDKMNEVCEELGIDYNMISQEGYERNEEYIKKRQDIVNNLCKNLCCKFNMITYVSIVKLIKG